MRHFVLVLLAAGCIGRAFCGEAAPLTPGDKLIRKFLASQAAELEREFLPGVKTKEDFEKLRPQLHDEYMEMLGLSPLPEKTPLGATVTGKLDMPGYVVEKLYFQSRPGLYVTANLYRPAGPGKYPAILYQCGHGDEKRDGNKTHYEDHGIWYATHGYVALLIDSLQLGEIGAIHHGTYRENRWWWHSAGYTPAGVECWNAIRAIDYLVTRPEVDADRIGATGISGGGAATFWISAADPRIKCCAPTSGMSDLQYYVGDDGVNGHCDCMFLYNRARWNWTTIAALICPRPMLFCNSDHDIIFPMPGNDRIINRLEWLYARYGLSDKVDAMVSVGGHAYRSDLRRATYEFFNRNFKNDLRAVTDPDSGRDANGKHIIEHEKLRAFPNELPADQINTKIDQLFVPEAKLELPAADKFDAWRKELLERLRVMTFNAWPASAPAVQSQTLGAAPSEGREETESGLEVGWRWVPGKSLEARWIVVLNPADELSKIPEWAAAIVGDGSALLVNPRGDAHAWTRKSPPNTIERNFALLGATVDSGRIWDILTILRRRPGHWKIAGSGNAGILAAYAALYEPSIESVVAVSPPPSHKPRTEGAEYGPPLLNVLRVLDIPDAFGLLAPRPLTLIGAKDPMFERTAAMYKLLGASEKLDRK